MMRAVALLASMMRAVALLAALGALLSARVSAEYGADALADEITNMPGAQALMPLKFRQFSGYLSAPGVTPTSKQMHYYFVESLNSPAADPVSLWTNGGPGCSGLIGAFTEMGPFRPNADKTVSLNEFAWNKLSSMLFIESPVGVGYSYSDEDADYEANDATTALLNYNLIQAFFARFPELRANKFYISSESYGGHYMPTLAKEIVTQNMANSAPKINFVGMAVGNPYTTPYSGSPAMYDTAWGHQLVPLPLWEQYVSGDCRNASFSDSRSAVACFRIENDISNAMGDLNPYALDYPVCLKTTTAALKSKRGRAQRLWLLQSQLQQRQSSAGPVEAKHRLLVEATLAQQSYQPCEDDYTGAYLNSPDVKAALHVKADVRWAECSVTTRYNMSDSDVSMTPYYNFLIDGGFNLSILVYSGDDDSVCGTIGTQSWIWGLGYPPKNLWQPYLVAGQTAGFLSQFAGTKMAFLTVHRAGHEVPTYVPDVALDMWGKFLAGDFTTF